MKYFILLLTLTLATAQVPGYTYIGAGSCTNNNGGMLDYCYYTDGVTIGHAKVSAEECGKACDGWEECIAFQIQDREFCQLFFNDGLTPDEYDKTDSCIAVTPYGSGEAPITKNNEKSPWGGHCYARGAEEVQEDTSTVEQTDAPADEETTAVEATSEPTGDVTGFTKIDSRKGWCYDANDHGFESCNYSADTKTKADVTAQECGVACQAMDMCIGFNYFDDSMTCSLLFSKDTIPDPNQENEDDNCVGQVPYGYGEGEMTHIFPTESGGYCYARNEETTTVEPTDPPSNFSLNAVDEECEKAITTEEECQSAFTAIMGDSEFKDRTVKVQSAKRSLPAGCFVNKDCDPSQKGGKGCRAHFNPYNGKRSKGKAKWAKMICC